MNIDKLDLAWLAGIWEGEGSICIFRNKRKGGTMKLSVTLTLVNTDPKLITESIRIMEKMNVKFHLFERKHNNPKWATAYQLTLRHFQQCKTFLEKLEPFLRGNKKQIALLTLRFLDSRIKAIEKNRNTPNSEKENKILNEVKNLNKRGVSKELVESSETRR